LGVNGANFLLQVSEITNDIFLDGKTTDSGLTVLDTFLADKSYIVGYVPSKADLSVFEAVKNAPATKFVNALRWYKHISSYTDAERASFGGDKKDAAYYLPAAAAKQADDEDELDLFGSDDEVDQEAEKVKAQRLAEYHAKKSKKPAVIAKSSIVLDVKPWDDETDLKALEDGVRAITMDGLLWGASKLVPIGYGIRKLQISCVVEDDKVAMDDLEEQILALEDYCQSVDTVAFNKI